ncbi:MAG: hypothetical protein IPP60_10740 [Sphingobacteriales bacterium]|nr:hypothetical protein [Sphingobacteriales bacterium]
MVLKPDNSLWVCGDGSNGKLGDGLYDSYNKLFKIEDNVFAMSGGTDHTMIIKKDNTLWECGYNYYGQLGIENTQSRGVFLLKLR